MNLLHQVEVEHWYAVHVRSRAEKVIDYRLQVKGLTTFLPVVMEKHRWSDRQKMVEVPLFACYVFVRMAMNHANFLKVVNVDGVLSFVGGCGQGTPIPDSQIDAVRTVIARNLPLSSHPFAAIGDRVRIVGGALDGIEGIVLAHDRSDTLVLSVEALERSVSICIAGYKVQPLAKNRPAVESPSRLGVAPFNGFTEHNRPVSQPRA